MICKKFTMIKDYNAVSPIVGVMLMLVVTIIIAAVVSGFSGGLMGGQDKVSQATIKGSFSISDGLQILHTGGDPLPMHSVIFTIWDSETFGPNVETISKQVLNESLFSYYDTDEKETLQVMGSGGTYNKVSFIAGDSILINSSYCNADLLQPVIAPTDYNDNHDTDGFYTGNNQKNRWSLCLKNRKNVGQIFVLTVSDTKGNLIAKTDVTITS